MYALAVARLTGLITQDLITEPVRDAVIGRLPANQVGEHLEDLITCPWCVSIWVAAVVAPLVYQAGDTPWVFVPAFALAMSQLTGMASAIGRS